jgi:hypothetical protein
MFIFISFFKFIVADVCTISYIVVVGNGSFIHPFVIALNKHVSVSNSYFQLINLNGSEISLFSISAGIHFEVKNSAFRNITSASNGSLIIHHIVSQSVAPANVSFVSSNFSDLQV